MWINRFFCGSSTFTRTEDVLVGGRRVIIEAVDGVFTVDLAPALCTQSIGDYCMIGSAPLYLTQANDGGAPPGLPLALTSAQLVLAVRCWLCGVGRMQTDRNLAQLGDSLHRTCHVRGVRR